MKNLIWDTKHVLTFANGWNNPRKKKVSYKIVRWKVKSKPLLMLQEASSAQYKIISPEVKSAPVWYVNNKHKVPRLRLLNQYATLSSTLLKDALPLFKLILFVSMLDLTNSLFLSFACWYISFLSDFMQGPSKLICWNFPFPLWSFNCNSCWKI